MKTISVIILIILGYSVYGFSYALHPKKDSTKVIQTNVKGNGISIELEFSGDKMHSHALIAVWIEDLEENYIQTLYVSRSVAKGIFEHGKKGNHNWEPAAVTRPATLPYWAHKRNIKNSANSYMPDPDKTVPDTYSGATPLNDFILKTKTDKPLKKFRLKLEINQPFDFNEFWTNNKFENNKAYLSSGQPALIYGVTIDTENPEAVYYLHPIGHSHHAGENGKLYTNLTTMTTAMKIVKQITVKLNE